MENSRSPSSTRALFSRLRENLIAPSISPRLTVGLAVAAVIVLVFAGGSAARILIPVVTTIAAYILHRTAPPVYVSYVWWTFFLACFLRRLSDYRTAFTDVNPILLVPFLAVLPAIISLKHRNLWLSKGATPFKLAIAATIYGFLIGLTNIPFKVLAVTTLGWTVPLIFGMYTYLIMSDERMRGPAQEALERTFVWGLLSMGVYGVLQYVIAPPWDTLWMTEGSIGAIGSPEPFSFRVFSTMNGPGAFAYVLMAGLLWLMKGKGYQVMIAGCSGLAALLLSSVRAAWAALLLGMALFIFKERKNLSRLIPMLGIAAVCIGGALLVEPIREPLEQRFSSLVNLSDDTSYQERQNGYREMVNYAATEPFGTGLGTMDAMFSDKTALGTRDSGFWSAVLSLGWLGAATYFCALIITALRTWPTGKQYTKTQLAASCICIGLMSQIFLGDVMSGVTGMAIWGFAGVALSEVYPARQDGTAS